MTTVVNETPFASALLPGVDGHGTETVTVLIKGTFTIPAADREPDPADDQVPVTWAAEYRGEPGTSSLVRESDVCPAKAGTDIVLNATAHAPAAVTELDVAVEIGPLQRRLRVIGDRTWERGFGRWRPTEPTPFTTMPLIWERAYGGRDASHGDPGKHDHDRRNPVGTGFTLGSRAHIQGLALPNVELPEALIRTTRDRPVPAGLGFVAGDWEPRRTLAGTYDEDWRTTRAPLLPRDFDPAFFSSAAADELRAAPHLRGGEQVRLTGLSPGGELRFRLPRRPLSLRMKVRTEWQEARPRMDTVLLEPDAGRLVVCWRATAPVPRSTRLVRTVKIRERRESP